jgi:hypothetical protein
MQNNTNAPKTRFADLIPDFVFSNILKHLDPLSQYRLCLTSKAYKEVFSKLLEDKHLLEKVHIISVVYGYVNESYKKCREIVNNKLSKRGLSLDCDDFLGFEEDEEELLLESNLYGCVIRRIKEANKSLLLSHDGVELRLQFCDDIDEYVQGLVNELNKRFGKKLVRYVLHDHPVTACYRMVIDFFESKGKKMNRLVVGRFKK